MKKIFAWLKNPRSDIFLFAVLLVLINLVAQRSFFRIDLTGPSSYTLSEGSKEAVKTLEEPLSVKVFFSENLNPPYSSVNTYVHDLLSEYQTAAGPNFSVEYFDLKSDESGMEDENVQLAMSYGLQQFRIREIKDNEVSFKNVFMGIVFTYADQVELLDGISSTESLEYNITSKIQKIVSDTNALSGLQDNIKVTFYKSENLNSFPVTVQNYSAADKLVSEAVRAANEKFHGRIDYETVILDEEQSYTIGKQYGILVLQWPDKTGASHISSLGLVISHGDKFYSIPFPLQNMVLFWGVSGFENLQENLTQGILNLFAKTKNIAYITGHDELDSKNPQTGAGFFTEMLSDCYTVEDLNVSENEIPVNIKTIIINGAKTSFSDDELYKIDQFVMKGGNLLVLNDTYETIMPQSQYQRSGPQFISISNGLDKLLKAYGVAEGGNFVLDTECFVQNDPEYGSADLYFAPITKKETINQSHPITRNLNYVIVPYAAPLNVEAARQNENLTVTELISSSVHSWETEANVKLTSKQTVPPDESKMSSKLMAVLLEGKFKSAFTEKPAKEGEENGDKSMVSATHLSESTQSGKVLVISTSFITTRGILENSSVETPNAIFIRNAVDYMSDNGDYASMRTKTLSLNELKESSKGAVTLAKWFNQIGLAILTAIAGILVLVARRSRRERIRRQYNPEDPREISKEASK